MKKETIVVASSNKGKISEIKEIFKDYDVLSIKDMENILGKKKLLTRITIPIKIMHKKK